MTQEELLKQIRTILNDLPFGEIGYRYKQTAFDACVKTAEWLQEQMMKDAIDSQVKWCNHGYPNIHMEDLAVLDEVQLPKDKFKIGDKVKVIIIKE